MCVPHSRRARVRCLRVNMYVWEPASLFLSFRYACLLCFPVWAYGKIKIIKCTPSHRGYQIRNPCLYKGFLVVPHFVEGPCGCVHSILLYSLQKHKLCGYWQARSHRGAFGGSAPKIFLYPQNLIVARKLCFKHIIKTKIVPP